MNSAEVRTGSEFYDTESPERIVELSKSRYRGLYQWQRVKQVAQLLEPLELQGKVVLEIGPGGGEWTLELLRRGAKIAVVDLRGTMVEAVRLRARMHGFDPNKILAAVGSFPEVELPVDECDLFFAKDVIEHIPAEKEMWECIGRVVKPGGYAILTTQNRWSLNYLLQAPYARYVKGERDWCGWDPTHLRFYTPRRLRRELTKSGFDQMHFISAHHIPFVFGPLKHFVHLKSESDFADLGAKGFVRQTRKSFRLPHCFMAALELASLNSLWPFDRVGWSIGIRARKRFH
jgi:2-polyprenyl-6-hydroxyphenyl methylase/3-demethylubiquinone-9 3-methyltransferase